MNLRTKQPGLRDESGERPSGPAKARTVLGRIAWGFTLALLAWVGLWRLGLAQMALPTNTEPMIWVGVIGALIGMTRFRSVLWVLCGVTVALLVVIGYTPLIVKPAQSLVRSEPPKPADAVVVLSSDVNDDGLLDNVAFDRYIGGLHLVRDGYAREIIRTWSPDSPAQPDKDARHTADLLPQPVRIETVGPVSSTHDEAKAVKDFCDRKGWRRILLVTSPMHSKRSAATFRRIGLQVISVPCEDRQIAVPVLRATQDRYAAFRQFVYEELAWRRYQNRGWV